MRARLREPRARALRDGIQIEARALGRRPELDAEVCSRLKREPDFGSTLAWVCHAAFGQARERSPDVLFQLAIARARVAPPRAFEAIAAHVSDDTRLEGTFGRGLLPGAGGPDGGLAHRRSARGEARDARSCRRVELLQCVLRSDRAAVDRELAFALDRRAWWQCSRSRRVVRRLWWGRRRPRQDTQKLASCGGRKVESLASILLHVRGGRGAGRADRDREAQPRGDDRDQRELPRSRPIGVWVRELHRGFRGHRIAAYQAARRRSMAFGRGARRTRSGLRWPAGVAGLLA